MLNPRDRRTYRPTPEAYVRLLERVPGCYSYGDEWTDATTPRTDRPVRFRYNSFGMRCVAWCGIGSRIV